MKNEKILNALDKVDEKFITASSPENTKKTKTSPKKAWVKWGVAAACLCLVAGIGVMNIDHGLSDGIPESGGGAPQLGGTVPEGVDPVVASLAVIPAGVDLLDVASSVLQGTSLFSLRRTRWITAAHWTPCRQWEKRIPVLSWSSTIQ